MTLLATRYRRFCVDIGIDIDAQKFIYGHLFYFLQILTKMHRISNVLISYTDIGYDYVLPTSGTLLPKLSTDSGLLAGRAGQVPQSSILEQHSDLAAYLQSPGLSPCPCHVLTSKLLIIMISSLLQWGPPGLVQDYDITYDITTMIS
jgi:hypothetical protein